MVTSSRTDLVSPIQSILSSCKIQVSDQAVRDCLRNFTGYPLQVQIRCVINHFLEQYGRSDWWYDRQDLYPETEQQGLNREKRIENNLKKGRPVIVFVDPFRLGIQSDRANGSDSVAILYELKTDDRNQRMSVRLFLPYDGGAVFEVSFYNLFRLMRDSYIRYVY